MKQLPFTLMVLACALAACGGGDPAVAVTGMQVIAPPPGRDVSVAYMTIHNDGREPVTLVAIGSPDFARVEMHDSELSDGVVRMRKLDELSIDAGGRLAFEPGGRHVMLFDPVNRGTAAGHVTLQLQFASDALLMIEAPVSARVAVE